MTIVKTVFAAAAALTVIGALSSASAQGYRDGEFRRFETEKHRFGEHCTYRVEAHGFAERKLFGGRPGGKAEARAIQFWQAQVSQHVGPQFANWNLAEGKSAACRDKGPLEIECVVAANPCREHRR